VKLPLNRIIAVIGLTLLVSLTGISAVNAQSIRGSKHDLSGMDPSYWGPVRDEICIFCHAPHNSSKDARMSSGPLWNRYASEAVFTPYSSHTISNECPATPGGPSLLCLGCHDGTTGGWGGSSSASKHDLINGYWDTSVNAIGNCAACHQNDGQGPIKPSMGPNGIGTDLTRSHPISMLYPSTTQNPQIVPPPTPQGWPDLGGVDGSGLRLYAGRLECPTCHNVHSPRFAPFLRTSNDNSAMCLSCHVK
jgi:predicted CXXCH cytochrome family protein